MNTATLLKYIWQFFNITNERFKWYNLLWEWLGANPWKKEEQQENKHFPCRSGSSKDSVPVWSLNCYSSDHRKNDMYVQRTDFNISGSVTKFTSISVTSDPLSATSDAINMQQTGKPFLQNTSASITRISGQNKMVVKDLIHHLQREYYLVKRMLRLKIWEKHRVLTSLER